VRGLLPLAVLLLLPHLALAAPAAPPTPPTPPAPPESTTTRAPYRLTIESSFGKFGVGPG